MMITKTDDGWTYLIFFHEVYKSSPFDFHGLSLPVVQREDKMEEVTLPEIAGWLFFEVSPAESGTVIITHKTNIRASRDRRKIRPIWE